MHKSIINKQMCCLYQNKEYNNVGNNLISRNLKSDNSDMQSPSMFKVLSQKILQYLFKLGLIDEKIITRKYPVEKIISVRSYIGCGEDASSKLKAM